MSNPYASPNAALDGHSAAGGGITLAIVDALRKTKGWVLLIGILLFIGAGFMLLGALGMLAASFMGGAASATMPKAIMIGGAAMYVVMGGLYGVLGLYLVKYSSAIGRFVVAKETAELEVALQSQQKFWLIAGIVAIVMIGMMILVMVAAIAMPMLMSAKG